MLLLINVCCVFLEGIWWNSPLALVLVINFAIFVMQCVSGIGKYVTWSYSCCTWIQEQNYTNTRKIHTRSIISQHHHHHLLINTCVSYSAAQCNTVIYHFFTISSKQIPIRCFSGSFHENATQTWTHARMAASHTVDEAVRPETFSETLNAYQAPDRNWVLQSNAHPPLWELDRENNGRREPFSYFATVLTA